MRWVIPAGGTYVLANAAVLAIWAPADARRIADGLARVDLTIADGKIAKIEPAGAASPAPARVDLAGAIILPGFVDMHTHLDKGHIWQRAPNPDGSFMGALVATHADRTANWTARDIEIRMEFALRCAYAHGTVAIRTHLDSLPPHHEITWDVFDSVRARWQGRIDLQAASLFTPDLMDQPGVFEAIVARTAKSGGVLGGVTFPMPDLPARLERMFRAAADAGLDVDLHVDETLDPEVLTLEQVADAALATGFHGRIVAGHCCSLSVQDDRTLTRVIDKLLAARIGIVSLPMCNLYLQDRTPLRTPRRRGVTVLHELRTAGVPVAVASDNARDPFYAYGDLDPLEVLREGVRIAHLDHPLDHAPLLVTQVPADMIGINDAGRLAVGSCANLVIFPARTLNELLSRPHSDRLVMRDGVPSTAKVPDYSELDVSLGAIDA